MLFDKRIILLSHYLQWNPLDNIYFQIGNASCTSYKN